MILQALDPRIQGVEGPQTNAIILQNFLAHNPRPVTGDRIGHIKARIDIGRIGGLGNPALFSAGNYGGELRLNLPRLEVPEAVRLPDVNAYWLPWRADTGYYADIPMQLPQAALFLTPELTGCYVGIQDMGTFWRVRHYNSAVEGEDPMHLRPTLTEDDLRRYGCDIWLIEDIYAQYYPNMQNPDTHYYRNHTAVWGEFINGGWHFFYKARGNQDIHFIV